MAKILFVEDEKERRSTIRVIEALESDHEVEIVYSGNEAVEKLVGSHYDLVLLDIMVIAGSGGRIPEGIKRGEMGIHILERLIKGEFEEKGTSRDVPVVVLSAIMDIDDIRRTKELLKKEEWYLSKPIRPSRVARVVNAAIEEARRGRKNG